MYENLTAVATKNTMTQCNLVDMHERFGGTYCLHLHFYPDPPNKLQRVIIQKNRILILNAKQTSNLKPLPFYVLLSLPTYIAACILHSATLSLNSTSAFDM
jgi:hypothetical protein